MQDFFRSAVKRQLSIVADNADIEMQEYNVIGDDLDGVVYTYASNNALSFSDVVENQLASPMSLPSVRSLKDVQNDLWAYCWSIKDDDGNTSYSFRKASKGKVSTDKAQTYKEKLSAIFDTTDSELKQLIGDTISFDNKIDCLYMDINFYVFYKKSFEQLVGLEEELRENAESVIKTIQSTTLVDGLENLKEELFESRQLLKILASIAQKKLIRGLM